MAQQSTGTDPLLGLVDTFERIGLLAYDDDCYVDDRDVADMLWLAQFLTPDPEAEPLLEELPTSDADPVATDSDRRPVDVEPLPAESDLFAPQSDGSSDSGDRPAADEDIKVDVVTNESQNLDERLPDEGLSVAAPAAKALQNSLAIQRALRPLMRKVAAKNRQQLDTEATVTRIAERDVWVPVTQPAAERWLEVELVVEESKSQVIWQEAIAEFQKILETHGAFRNVRVWSIFADADGEPQLQRRRGRGVQQLQSRKRVLRELIHADRRGLILFVSDCTSDLWRQGKIHPVLRQWSQQTVTAVVQMFPEWMWQSTTLSLGRKFFATAMQAGTLNQHLRLAEPPRRFRLDGRQDLALPVLTMEPQMLAQWSGVMIGKPCLRIPVYVFKPEDLPAADAAARGTETKAELTADMRVDHFLQTTAFRSQYLAGYLAAAPVSMPVVNLIRRTMFAPAETPELVHVAEVYMGGLIRLREDNPDPTLRVYDFYDGVRSLLVRSMRQDKTEKVLDILSAYISERLGRSPLRDFRAFLRALPELSTDQDAEDEIIPFARVALEVLEDLGDRYADFAAEVRKNIELVRQRHSIELKTATFRVAEFIEEPELDEFEYTVDVVEFVEVEPDIEWIEFEAETAILTTLETELFTFESASLEIHQQGLSRREEIVTQRQNGEVEGLTESLNSNLDLKMVIIPAGSFVMGAPKNETESRNNERPQHLVSLPSFYLGQTQITQAQWREVAGWEPVERKLEAEPSRFKGEYRPVERVSWADAEEFCARLSQRTGKKYRLPSEAEWEYACRAVNSFQSPVTSEQLSEAREEQLIREWNKQHQKPFHFGETLTTKLANYDGNYSYGKGKKGRYREETIAVGSFPANSFGLSDMHGNVDEWCEDDYHGSYENAPRDGRVWLDKNDSNTIKVIRGGSWDDESRNCRSACRVELSRDGRDDSIGFRVACSLPGALSP